jgi:hypothetical protein
VTVDEYESLEIDEDSEDLAYLLTLVAGKVNPHLHMGRTYEVYLTLLVQLINGYAVTEEEALAFGQRILDSQDVKDEDLH